MLKLATKSTYKRNIHVEIPLDMGKTEKQSFVMEFRRLSVSETKDLIAEAQDRNVTDEEMIKRYAVSWSGLAGEDGEEIAFNNANLEMVMDVSYMRKAIMQAFVEDVFGKEAARKN